MKKILWIITLFITFTANINVVSAKEYMVNPFYAVQSSTEYGQVKNTLLGDKNHMYFQWGRITMDDESKMVFTNKLNSKISSYDNRTEYGFPGEKNLKDYTETYPKGKVFLSIFFDACKYENDKNSVIEFLNMKENQWQINIIDPIIEMAETYKFDGVVLDFEGFRNNYDSDIYSKEQKLDLKNKYNDFLKLFKDSLDKKEMIVCINPTNVAGYYDGYDYKFINNIADYVLLMAYGYEHKILYDLNDPIELKGKVKYIDSYQTQPYNKIKEAVENLIKNEGVESNKIILGMDLGGMKWIKLKTTLNGKNYEYYAASRPYLEGIENLKVEGKYLEEEKISIKTLDKSEILQKDKDTYEKPGVEIEQVNYYYESAESLFYKYNNIVQALDLAGLSVWRLGIGSENAWQNLINMSSIPDYINKDEIMSSDKTWKDYNEINNKVSKDKSWHIKFNCGLDKESITKDNIYVRDSKGIKLDVKIELEENNIILVHAPTELYSSGEKYYLFLTSELKSENKNKKLQKTRIQFIIE